MVFVDDGSTDRTFELIGEAAASDLRVVGVRLSRNFGHQAALTAALETVTGDVVVVMDGDLRIAPRKSRDSWQNASAGSTSSTHSACSGKSLPLRAAYFTFYRLMTRLSEVKVPVDSGDFALLSRRVVDELNLLPERHRYIRGLRTWGGFRQTGSPVERDARAGGEPSYPLRKLFRRLRRRVRVLVTPLRAAWLVGAIAAAAASVYALWAVFQRLFLGTAPQGFAALIVAIVFFSGIQLLFLGLIGEYLGRVYDEAKGRPHFIVTDVVRGGGHDASR
jgi:dolichol-phosphate mannosyltransferase